MADFNVSVTMSNEPANQDISAGSTNNFIVSNPLSGSSYFALETVKNSNGAYDSNSPKNLEGTITGDSGIPTIIKDNYKAGVVVAPGGGTFIFTPTNAITANTLRFRGVGDGFADTSSLPSFIGLLDEYSGSIAAFSTRKLLSTYTGSAIEVYRDIDNTVQDIGFDSNGNLDTGSLLSFVNSVEVFTNPDITSATGWTIGANTTYNAGTEAFDLLNENGLTVRQGVSVEGRVYNVTLTISSTTSGGVKVYAGGNQSAVYSTVGTHELTITGGSANNILGINPDGSVTLSISAFSAIDTTNNGYVRTWYDQSGNVKNLTQTTFSSMPKIVNTGSVIIEGGNPTLEFDGSSDFMESDSISSSQPVSYFHLRRYRTTDQVKHALNFSTDSDYAWADFFDGSVLRAYFGSTGFSSVGYSTNRNLWSVIANGASSIISLNSVSSSANVGSNNVDAITLGKRAAPIAGVNAAINSQELIVYLSDVGTTNFKGIETNINTYYNIYSLLEQYPGSVGGYSLRKISALYTGSAIEVTRESDSTTQDIGFDSNGDLDTSALATFCAGTNGFITTWYDQGTNVNNATTPTLGSSPKIYDSSTGLITVNGKPAMLFDEGDEFFQMPIPSSSRQDFFVVLKTNDPQWILMEGDDTSDYNFAVNSASLSSAISSNYGTPSYYKNGVLQSPSTRTDMYNIFSTDTQLLLTNLAGDSSTWGNQFDFGFYSSVNSLQGYVQEAIYYNSDQSSNQSDIENNINSYYNIYS